jgi:Domain of unknown function (DUF1735)
MQKYSIILKGLLLVTGLAVVNGSCVKTAPDYTNFSDISPIAELFTGGPTVNLAYITTQSTPTDYTIEVNLASPNPASKPLSVTLAIDTADFNEMNDSLGDIYTLLPSNVYTVPSWTVTIATGQHLASLHIEVNSGQLGNTSVYVLPLKIINASGTTISGNFGNGYWQFIAANAYTGLYQSVGYKRDVGVVTNINQEKYLYFADPNPAFGLGYVGTNTVIGQAGDDVTYIDYGIAMDLTVDPVSDTVLVTSDPNQGARGKIPLFNNGPCIYDPVKRTFTLNYAYVNAYGNTDTLYEVLTWKALPQ